MGADQELRGSIAAVGCVDPVLIWYGTVIDGRKRLAICEELGIVPKQHVCVTLEAACSALFLKHPQRAIALAREHLGGQAGLPPSIQELAAKCGTSVSAIAVQLHGPRPPEKRAPHRTRSQRTEGVKLWVEPQWLHYVKQTGERLGLNLSQTIRVACWEFVQKHHPKQPTEGTYRSPSRESVVKPELRRPIKKKPP